MSDTQQIDEISVSDLKARLDNGERPTLVDVREPFEWNIANLGEYGARMIPMKELRARASELDQDDEIILYCRSGRRSADAAAFLKASGFPRVVNMKGGILAWAREIDPSLPSY